MSSDSSYRRWSGPMVWDGPRLQQNGGWIVELDQDDIYEIREAIDSAISTGKSLAHCSSKDFPFTRLGERLLEIRDELLEGRGFALLRGLRAEHWTDLDLIYAYWGIGSWIGHPVSQNAGGHLLGHIIDQRQDPSPEIRLYQTSKALSFHSDSCDIVGLLTLREAPVGGASYLASSAAIHNVLLDQEPELLHQLYGLFQCDRYGEIPEGKKAYYGVHVFNEVEDNFVCCGMDPDIRSAQRLDEVPALSSIQVRALDRFQALASDLALGMTLQRGDMQFVNNLTVVHAREAYKDHANPDRRRYLIRLWLSSPYGRTLPAFMAERWGNIKTGTLRGGINVPGAKPVVHLNPYH